MNAAMGGQRLLWQAAEYSALPDAIADCAYSIAFGRWAEGELSMQWLAQEHHNLLRRLSGKQKRARELQVQGRAWKFDSW